MKSANLCTVLKLLWKNHTCEYFLPKMLFVITINPLFKVSLSVKVSFSGYLHSDVNEVIFFRALLKRLKATLKVANIKKYISF